MEAKVIWKEELTFDGIADSGLSLPLKSRKAPGEKETGFRPMELFAVGLAGCTAMDVVSILQKKRQQVTAFEVKAHVDRAEEHPTVFTRAVVEYIVTGINVDEAAVKRSIELSATRYCPAHAMMAQIFPIELKYRIFEDDENGENREVKSGIFEVNDSAQQVGESG